MHFRTLSPKYQTGNQVVDIEAGLESMSTQDQEMILDVFLKYSDSIGEKPVNGII